MILGADVLVVIAWATGFAAATWLVLWPVWRRSLAGMLAAVVATGTATSVGAFIGAVQRMVLPMHDESLVLSVAVAAGVVGALAAVIVARRLERDHRALRDAVRRVAGGSVPELNGPRLTAELDRIRADLRRTGIELARSRERERALEASRRQIVASLSHDLRTPLAGLRALAEGVEDGVIDDAAGFPKQVGVAVERLSAMVDDLFALARVEAGLGQGGVVRLALDDLVSDCVAALTPLARARGIDLGRAGDPPAAPVIVLGSPGDLDRVLTNLVANAIRYSPGGGTVRVRVAATSGQAVVSVSDTCGGIPADELERLFEPGFRGVTAWYGDQAGPGQERGAGLGLAIAAGIARAHDGRIDVRNTDVGCCFTLTLGTAR